MSDLRENLRRLIVLHITSSGHTVDELADAAIALVRAETLEEAARVAEDWAERNVMDDTSWRDIKALIAAIRALESKP
jgi:hypothetical protein